MAPVQPPGRIETLNGTQLYFEVHGSGWPVVLLQGFSGSRQDWSSTIAEWRAHFELIVPDMRGHGRSAMLSRSFRHQDAAADILALLDLLNVSACKGLGIRGAVNDLLNLASTIPEAITP